MTRTINRISLPTPFPVGPVNAFLVTGGDAPVLVDTGVNTDECLQRLRDGLAAHGVAFGDLGAILLTHGHLDHAGLLGRLQQETDAPAYAHPLVAAQYAHYEDDVAAHHVFVREDLERSGVPAPVMEKILGARDAVARYGGPARIDHALCDGEFVAGLRTIFAPGHSPADVIFHDEDGNAAITGDHILKGMSPNPLARRPRPGVNTRLTLLEYRRSLEQTRTRGFAVCHPGHGGAIADYAALIDNILERYAGRLEQVEALLEDAAMTPYDVVVKLFPNLGAGMLHFGLSLVKANLEVLVEEERAREESGEGRMLFSKRR